MRISGDMAVADSGSLNRQRHYCISGVSTIIHLSACYIPWMCNVALLTVKYNLCDGATSRKSKKPPSRDGRISPMRKALHHISHGIRFPERWSPTILELIVGLTDSV